MPKWNFNTTFGQQQYSNQLYGSPLNNYYVHIGVCGNPLITDTEKHALRPFYSLDLKIGMLIQTCSKSKYSEYSLKLIVMR